MKNEETAPTLMTTAEVAEYLRLKERTVYEMAGRQQIPCSRATGKLLFSRSLIDAWVESRTEIPEGVSLAVPRIYAGSSEPLLEWALRQSGAGLAILVKGSRQGLQYIADGEAVLAGTHLIDPGTGRYDMDRVRALVPRRDIVAIHWARRTQGLLVAAGNPLGLTGLADAAGRKLRFARRVDGAGSQALLEFLLRREGMSSDDLVFAEPSAESQDDLAGMIDEGSADCGIGIKAAARGLDFLPLWPCEEFDLVMRRRDYFEPPLQALLAFARSDAFRRHAEHLGGYDLSGLGEVRLNV
jgi:putative molybdopterin biosynthesis protein